MVDIEKLIKQGIDDTSKGIRKAAEDVGNMAAGAAGFVGNQLGELRDKSEEAIKGAGEGLSGIIDGIVHHNNDERAEEHPRAKEIDEYEKAIIDYNQEYIYMSDRGMQLHHERERSGDLLAIVEELINSIANTPKEFQTTFELIRANKDQFTSAEQYAKDELDATRKSAMSAGGGLAASAAVASMAPSAAMWIATTFGTASTGTAISTLSGAAASQAALAWLGGGALAAGGAGTTGGSALLAMAGPVGWGIAGATLLTSIILFARKRFQLNQQKQEELMKIKENTGRVKRLNEQIDSLVGKTVELRENLKEYLKENMALYGSNYPDLADDEKCRLGALVNNAKALGEFMIKDIGTDE